MAAIDEEMLQRFSLRLNFHESCECNNVSVEYPLYRTVLKFITS